MPSIAIQQSQSHDRLVNPGGNNLTRLLLARFTLIFLAVIAFDVAAMAAFWTIVIAVFGIFIFGTMLLAIIGLILNPGLIKEAVERRHAERARIASRNALLREIQAEAAQAVRDLGRLTTAERAAAANRRKISSKKNTAVSRRRWSTRRRRTLRI